MTTRSDWTERTRPLAERYARTAFFPQGQITAAVRADPDAVLFVARVPEGADSPSRAGAVVVSREAVEDDRAALTRALERLIRLAQAGSLPECPATTRAPILDLLASGGFTGPQAYPD